MRSLSFPSLVAVVLATACSTTTTTGGGKTCKAHAECAQGTEFCDVGAGTCATITPGRELGTGDGSAASVTFTEIHSVNASEQLIDLAFNPEDPTQLWALGYGSNRIHVGTGLPDDPQFTSILDPAALHFMHRPTGIAMGAPGEWATCGNNDNSQNDRARVANYFMGPSLWTTDFAILGKPTAGGLGSHIDMLHSTPFCRGIAHQEERWYWVFNAHDSAIDKYSFATPHEPGGDDHSDGEIYRYAAGQVKGAPEEDGTPSHLFYDPSDQFLYIADTGNSRIVKLDTTSGTKGGQLPRRNEPLVANAMMMGTNVEVVVGEGLQKPAGLEVKNDTIYVTDAATSTFHAFDKTGKEIRRLATDLPPDSLAGFTFGPDGRIWFVDRKGGRILRIDAW